MILLSLMTAGFIDTGVKFTASVNETSSQQCQPYQIVYTLHTVQLEKNQSLSVNCYPIVFPKNMENPSVTFFHMPLMSFTPVVHLELRMLKLCYFKIRDLEEDGSWKKPE